MPSYWAAFFLIYFLLKENCFTEFVVFCQTWNCKFACYALHTSHLHLHLLQGSDFSYRMKWVRKRRTNIIYECIYEDLEKWHQISSVAQSCPTLCDPMNCSKPGLPVHHQLPESTQIHVCWVSDAIQPSHPLSAPAFNLSQHQGLFKWIGSSHQVAKVLEFQLQHQTLQWTPRIHLL